MSIFNWYSVNTKGVKFEYQVHIHTCFEPSLLSISTLNLLLSQFLCCSVLVVTVLYKLSEVLMKDRSDYTGCVSQLCSTSHPLSQTTGSHYSPDLTMVPGWSNGHE